MCYDEITVVPGEPVPPVANQPLPPELARWLTVYRGAVKVPVTGYSCLVVAGSEPTLCSEAEPLLPRSVLPSALRAVRRLNDLPPGTTIHWVGHETGIRNRCPHYPDAPFAAPFDKGRWFSVLGKTKSQEVKVNSTSRLPKGERRPPTEADGLFGAGGFRFCGVEVRFGRAAKQYALVAALWSSASNQVGPARKVEDVVSEVYGDDHDTSDPAVRQLCSDVRRRLQTCNCPIDIVLSNGKLQLSPL
jgi:hypothetical protein